MQRNPLHIRNEHHGSRHRLSLRGELDYGAAPLLEGRVLALCQAGTRELVLDLGELEFIDSAGLGAILRVRALCEQHLCTLAIAPAHSGPVGRVFERTRLFERLPFAAASPQPAAAAPR